MFFTRRKGLKPGCQRGSSSWWNGTGTSRVRSAGWSAALLIFIASVVGAPSVGATEGDTIPNRGTTTLPSSTGSPGYGIRIIAPAVPQNPYLTRNPFNNVHNDAWLTDTTRIAGPTGADLVLRSNTLAETRRQPSSAFFVCGTLTFDRKGRIITPCVGPGEDSLVMIDPVTLKVLTSRQMPVTSGELGAYGSAYMFMDNRDRVHVTARDHVLVFAVQEKATGPTFQQVADYDLSAAVPADDAIQSVMPDGLGRLWFLVQRSGLVGVYDPRSAQLQTLHLEGLLSNSFAVDHTTAYIVSTVRMYRIDAGTNGRPRVTWSAKPYENIGETKPGQKSAGSGTSPTLLAGGRFVAINDNARQMHVVVYRTDKTLRRGADRTVCTQPVFAEGKGASENSLVAWNRSMVVQNTYGYDISQGLDSPATEPGLARVDVNDQGNGCHLAWSNDTVRIPSVLGKVSLRTGMLYTMTRVDDPETDVAVYYWAGINMSSGAIRWQQMAGRGNQWDSYVPGAAIGPTGTLYAGLYGGIASASGPRCVDAGERAPRHGPCR